MAVDKLHHSGLTHQQTASYKRLSCCGRNDSLVGHVTMLKWLYCEELMTSSSGVELLLQPAYSSGLIGLKIASSHCQNQTSTKMDDPAVYWTSLIEQQPGPLTGRRVA